MATDYVPYAGPVVTRADAKAAGLKHYFTGLPCRRGHLAIRYASDGACYECSLRKCREWQQNNREKSVAASQKYQRANADKVKVYRKRFYESNAERLRAASREWRANHRTEKSLSARAYYLLNAEARRDYSTSYRRTNPDDAKRRVREWTRAHPEATRVYQARRRSAKSASQSNYTRSDVLNLFLKQKGKCVGCLRRITKGYHVDHVKPLSRGGSNAANNIQLLCQPCNQRKHAKDPIVWARQSGRLL